MTSIRRLRVPGSAAIAADPDSVDARGGCRHDGAVAGLAFVDGASGAFTTLRSGDGARAAVGGASLSGVAIASSP
jgi:hypothetical protein